MGAFVVGAVVLGTGALSATMVLEAPSADAAAQPSQSQTVTGYLSVLADSQDVDSHGDSSHLSPDDDHRTVWLHSTDGATLGGHAQAPTNIPTQVPTEVLAEANVGDLVTVALDSEGAVDTVTVVEESAAPSAGDDAGDDGAGDDTADESTGGMTTAGALTRGDSSTPTAKATSTAVNHPVSVVVMSPKNVALSSTWQADAEAALQEMAAYWASESGGAIQMGQSKMVNAAGQLPTCDRGNPWAVWDAALQLGISTSMLPTWNPNQHLLVIAEGCPSDPNTGVGTIGTAPIQDNTGTLYPLGYALAWEGPQKDTVAHELGHNLGLEHANVLVCPNAASSQPGKNPNDSRVDKAMDPGCQIWPYGDGFDVMSYSGRGNFGSLSGIPASYLGFDRGLVTIPLKRDPETITLTASSESSGTRTVTVKEPLTNEQYWITLRANDGHDAGIQDAKTTAMEVAGFLYRWDYGVKITKAIQPASGFCSSTVVFPYCGTAAITNPVSAINSAARSTTFPEGATFRTELDGLVIEVNDISGTQATITVSQDWKDFTGKPAVKISGSTAFGGTLTGSLSGLTPASSSTAWQWLKDGKAISGATRTTYKPVVGDIGHKITVRAAGRSVGYRDSAAATSAATTITHGTFTGGSVKVTGTMKIGHKRTAEVTGYSPAPSSHKYQWYAGSAKISGATGKTFTLTKAQAGKSLWVQVTPERSGYQGAAKASSKATLKQIGPGTVKIANASAHRVGKTLRAKKSGFTGHPTVYSYQWLRNGHAISGSKARRSTYKVTSKDVGKKISVRITAKRSGFLKAVKTSAKTSKVTW
ncbi:MAG: hypothetical protein LBH13_03795 [Cellulomonadaceae bacterium]|nr:hypothetical protein [Cellulomonadaceae bacterium]